jgi:gamma-glutamylcyclotransferase (GGCT)/AIG2-like uncharacterized protein YtfP
MGNNITKLFVYGSLRSGFHHPAYDYISKHFTLVSEGKVKGRLYDLGSYPAAIPTTDEAYIIGELYDLKATSDLAWVIEQLDAYEGLHPEEGEEPLYKRELAEIYHNGSTSTAWIYWYSRMLHDEPIIPSGDIFDFVQQKRKL